LVDNLINVPPFEKKAKLIDVLIVASRDEITENITELIEATDIDEVEIRSVLTCEQLR